MGRCRAEMLEKFRKERNLHRMHHNRIAQEKNKLVTDIKVNFCINQIIVFLNSSIFRPLLLESSSLHLITTIMYVTWKCAEAADSLWKVRWSAWTVEEEIRASCESQGTGCTGEGQIANHGRSRFVTIHINSSNLCTRDLLIRNFFPSGREGRTFHRR